MSGIGADLSDLVVRNASNSQGLFRSRLGSRNCVRSGEWPYPSASSKYRAICSRNYLRIAVVAEQADGGPQQEGVHARHKSSFCSPMSSALAGKVWIGFHRKRVP